MLFQVRHRFCLIAARVTSESNREKAFSLAWVNRDLSQGVQVLRDSLRRNQKICCERIPMSFRFQARWNEVLWYNVKMQSKIEKMKMFFFLHEKNLDTFLVGLSTDLDIDGMAWKPILKFSSCCPWLAITNFASSCISSTSCTCSFLRS